jgi:cephalosporin-C deacetylase-like acetyl esterase
VSDRRTFLKQAAAVVSAPSLSPAISLAAANKPTGSYNDEMPDMLLHYLAKKSNELSAEWDRKRAQIRTSAALEERNRFVRARCIEMIHGLPKPNPLDATTVRVHQRDGYRIENVMFQSRPNFWVTASLYVPTFTNGPFPGIISPCGHSEVARLYPPYQFMYLGLVKEGFVVLAYDPIGQGERRYFWNPETNQNEIGGPVTWEHSLPGQLLLLLGEDLTHYRIWDGMRAIDYLLTRPEVDPQRIGCCGQSGGGTLTLFISALDERIRCAAVHEGGTRRQWPVEIRPETRLGTGDTEQHFFPAGIYGIDLPDLHVAIAPRPLLATIENFNPDFDAAARDIRARYELFGVPEKFSAEEAVDPHDMTMKLRLANTNWFCRWFYNRKGPEVEPDFKLETAQDMNCTPNGSIRHSGKGDTIYSLILKKQANLPPGGTISKAAIARAIRYRKPEGPLAVRHIATTPRRRYHIEKLQFLSEPGVYIPASLLVPDNRAPDNSAILYINDHGKEQDALEFELLEQLTQKGNLVIAADVRGIGETKPDHPDDSGCGLYGHVDDAETTMQYMAWEMNQSLFGMRVQDVVRCVDYVLSRTDVDRGGLRAIGRGKGALWLLYAAALDTRITQTVCDGGLLSYRTLTSTDRYLHAADIFVPDVLPQFDLPQVASAVADRRLAILAPVNAMKSVVDPETVRLAYDVTDQAYANAGKPENFATAARSKEQSRAEQYLELLLVE